MNIAQRSHFDRSCRGVHVTRACKQAPLAQLAGHRFYRIQLYTVITLHTQLNTAYFYMATARHRTSLNVHNSIQHNSTRHNLTRHNSTRHNSTRYNSTRPQLDTPQLYTATTRHTTTLHGHNSTLHNSTQTTWPYG